MTSDPYAADRVLVERCLAGDPAAWETFVHACTPVLLQAVRKTVRRLLRRADPSLEEDLVQETLAFLARPGDNPLARFRWECPLDYYLSAVAVQRCLRALRSRQEAWQREDLLPLLADTLSPQPAPLETAGSAETRRKVLEALQKLPDRERLAVQMFYWEELPAEEIGGLLGLTREAAWQVLSRAREQLKSLLRSSLHLIFIF